MGYATAHADRKMTSAYRKSCSKLFGTERNLLSRVDLKEMSEKNRLSSRFHAA
jgi:hypothetical protein